MNPLALVSLILAAAGTAVNIRGIAKSNNAMQSLGVFIVMIAVAMAVISQI